MRFSAEYIWIDGNQPTKKLRSKNQILTLGKTTEGEKSFEELSSSVLRVEMERLFHQQDWWGSNSSTHLFNELLKTTIPNWGFDGSSTNQADTAPSDRPLVPVFALVNPLRSKSILVLCEVLEADGKTPHSTNTRRRAVELANQHAAHKPWFGIEQEFTLFESGILSDVPLGWPERGQPDAQGRYYCGVGLDEVPGHDISLKHEELCRDAGLQIRGTNGEVMPGQWEFQTDTCEPLTVADHLWVMRYILYRVAAEFNATVKLSPKPISGDWNGAGAHTNFSTAAMRAEVDEGDGTTIQTVDGFAACEDACRKLGQRFEAEGFPSVYGHNFQKRLTGAHETCSHEEFKFGVADRGASVRIPLHVQAAKKGYIEDRRPSANIDPYEVVSYLMETICT